MITFNSTYQRVLRSNNSLQEYVTLVNEALVQSKATLPTLFKRISSSYQLTPEIDFLPIPILHRINTKVRF